VTAIKICGITRDADAALAASLGAHALGFVLWPGSPRYIPLARVRTIVAGLPPFVTPVGVFVDPTAGALGQPAAPERVSAFRPRPDGGLASNDRSMRTSPPLPGPARLPA
jgi:phosphoribosylanthranilate isomerase